MKAELGVAVTVGIIVTILLPQQTHCHMFATQFSHIIIQVILKLIETLAARLGGFAPISPASPLCRNWKHIKKPKETDNQYIRFTNRALADFASSPNLKGSLIHNSKHHPNSAAYKPHPSPRKSHTAHRR